jgi:hypothetical protein
MKPMRFPTPVTTLSLVLWMTIGTSVSAQDSAPKSPPDPSDSTEKASKDSPAQEEVPKVVDLGDHRYRYGSIEFNGKTREIRVPAQVNMREGIIEYALVHGTGKIHESLLVTEVAPSHLQTVMKLCRFKSGEGDVFDPFFPVEEQKGEAGAKERGEAVELSLEWEVDGEHKAKPLSDWIFDRKTETAMVDEPWIFTGSYFYSGTFMADADGLLVGIYLERGSLLNTMTDGSENDERWLSHGDNTPEIGTNVVVVLAPVQSENAKTPDSEK